MFGFPQLVFGRFHKHPVNRARIAFQLVQQWNQISYQNAGEWGEIPGDYRIAGELGCGLKKP
jgi:hypothetical protein